MNAIEFVKKFGIIVAKDLAYRDNTSIGYLSVEHHNLNQEELKQIVEAFDLIEKDFESVQIAEYEYIVSDCYSDQYWIEVRKAINLLEQCQK